MAGYLTHFGLTKARTPYKDVVPPLTKTAFNGLVSLIKTAGGVQSRILVDEVGAILDGHSRQSIEPDCPFDIVHGLTTDAEKRAFAFAMNKRSRQMTNGQWIKALQKMKPTAFELRTQGMTQDQVADFLGTTRTTISTWERAASRNSKNDKPVVSAKVGRPKKVTPEVSEQVKSLLASGKTQSDVATELGISQRSVSAAKNGKPKTISGRAMAVREQVAAGATLAPAAAKHRFTRNTYQRAAVVAESGDERLVKAMDAEVLTISGAWNLVDKSDEEITQAVEEAGLKVARKKHAQYSSKGKPVAQLVKELLRRTWVDWRGFNTALSRNNLPKAKEEKAELLHSCGRVREAVTSLLDRIEMVVGDVRKG